MNCHCIVFFVDRKFKFATTTVNCLTMGILMNFFWGQKLQTGLIPNSALAKWTMQKYTIPMTNSSNMAIIELKFFIKFWCVFFLELIMQRAYGLISRPMSPMSYLVYSIQHYIWLYKIKFDNDLRHVSGLSRLLRLLPTIKLTT